MKQNANQLPDLLTISQDLKDIYIQLPSFKINLFKRIYKIVWNYVFSYSKVDDLAQLYCLPLILRSCSPVLTMHQFLMFAKCFTLTRGGEQSIDSRKIEFTPYERQYMQILTRIKLISRGAFDPLRPSERCTQHVFIALTPAGVKYFNEVSKELKKVVLYDSRMLL